jgi:zinc protease
MTRLLLPLLAALAALPAAAQPFPSTPPAPGAPRPFAVPEGRSFTLPNGIEVRLVPYGTLPKVSVAAVVRAGNVDETAAEPGLADLVGALMEEGTTGRTAAGVAEAAAAMGGAVGVSVGPDQTTVSGSALAEFGPELAGLVAEVLTRPALPEGELERVARDFGRGLTISRSQPGNVALATFREALYGAHPYGQVFPDPEAVQALTIADVRRFYGAHFGAARTRVYVVGRFDEAAVEAAVREAFGGWARGTTAEPPRAAPQRPHVVYLKDQPGAAQSNVYVGLPTIDPTSDDYVAFQVMNALLGGSFGSRITRNIREDKGYTYSPFSQLSARFRDGYWAQVAAIQTPATGPALTEILAEIRRLQGEPPPAEELAGIQNYLAGTFVLNNATRQGILGQLAFLDLHGLPRTYLTGYVQRVHAVTPADVQRVARTYLPEDQLTIVVVGDRSVVEEQLRAFGEVRIVE